MDHDSDPCPPFPWVLPALQKVWPLVKALPRVDYSNRRLLSGHFRLAWTKLSQNHVPLQSSLPDALLAPIFQRCLPGSVVWRFLLPILVSSSSSHKHLPNKYLAYLVQSWHLLLKRHTLTQFLNKKVFYFNWFSIPWAKTCVISLPLFFSQKQSQLHSVPMSLHGLFKKKWQYSFRKPVAWND